MIYHIYRDGRHYDRFFPEAGGDLAFWFRQAEEWGGPVLELGCGTGRLALALAGRGYEVVGIDNSRAMLDEARRKSSAENVDVEWIEADMRRFDLGRTFSLVILPANTLCHLLSLGDFEACVGNVKNHLAPGGKFVIDVFVPKMELLVDRGDQRSPFAEYDDPDGRGRVVVTESYVYESDTQIKRVTTHHSVAGGEEVEGELNMRMYFPQELDALLKYNGFDIVAKYGDGDGTPFGPESEKQLVVCSVRRGTQ